MKSIENMGLEGDEIQPVLVSNLKSEDFFLLKAFPTAKFSISGGKLDEEPHLSSSNCEVDRTLDPRGVKADISFSTSATKKDIPILLDGMTFYAFRKNC